ncbi:Nicotinamide riboside kinase [Yarrowia sp. B02]|nr:Nicotinamide riboside kinase [Yarrowia sp. B02]
MIRRKIAEKKLAKEDKREVTLVALSGPSSSGKSTLARLLRDILPHVIIIHQDDFYLEDSQIPVIDGVQDWDCPEAFDFDQLSKVLSHVKETGELPADFKSKEDQNSLGPAALDEKAVDAFKRRMHPYMPEFENKLIVILDGIMVYHDAKFTELFDIKILVRSTYEDLKARREARSGYVTLEGFWKDPEGYFHNIVWPGYLKTHKQLFENENPNGEPSKDATREGIRIVPTNDFDVAETLDWVFDVILDYYDLE